VLTRKDEEVYLDFAAATQQGLAYCMIAPAADYMRESGTEEQLISQVKLRRPDT